MSTRTPSLLLVFVTALLCAPAGAGDKPPVARRPYVPPAADSREVRAAQQVLDLRHRKGRVLEEVADELAAIGPEAAPVFVAMLIGVIEKADYGEGGLTLGEVGDEVARDDVLLVEALRRLPPAKVADAVGDACAGGAALDVRLVGLRVLSDIGGANAVPAWIEIAGGIEEMHLQRAYVRATLDEALGNSLGREPAGFELLTKRARALEPRLLPALVRACVIAQRSQGVDVLLALLGRERELDLDVLENLPTLAQRTIGGLPEAKLTWLRPFLADEDWRVRRSAAIGLGKLCDPVSVSELIHLLSDEQRVVSQAALASLRGMSGKDGLEDAHDWETWNDEERHWFDEHFAAWVEALAAPEAEKVVEAARELAGHPLYRHESAAAIARALANTDPLVLQGLCSALTQLGSMAGAVGVIELLRHPEDTVRASAYATLQSLSGRKLPPEPGAWSQALRE